MNRIWPPRPEAAIAPQLIPFFENRGYVAQIKKNGTCSVAVVDPQGNVEFRTRHWEPHKAWVPTDDVTRYFSGFPDSVFIFELLHSKTTTVKNTAYVFDVVRRLGRDLTGVPLMERLSMLTDGDGNPHVQIACTYSVGLKKLYEGLVAPEDEGVVLKDPQSVLRPVFRDGLNSAWQVKCRRGTKNYSF